MTEAHESLYQRQLKILLISRSIPSTPTGSAVIVGNLAQQFSREEMIIVGAKSIGHPPGKWDSTLPQQLYASIHPPDYLRGGRWLRWIQLPLILIVVLVCCAHKTMRCYYRRLYPTRFIYWQLIRSAVCCIALYCIFSQYLRRKSTCWLFFSSIGNLASRQNI